MNTWGAEGVMLSLTEGREIVAVYVCACNLEMEKHVTM